MKPKTKTKMAKNYSRTIGVFYGSRSAEHSESCQTAALVVKSLVELGFNVVGIYLDVDGRWYLSPASDLNSRQSSLEPSADSNLVVNDWTLHLNRSGKLHFSKKQMLRSEEFIIDLAFPAFHGLAGEDGTFQGLCDLLSVPYIGCGLTTSVLALDKVLAKDVLEVNELPTKPYAYFNDREWHEGAESLHQYLTQTLSYPLYVKPARLGGSVGVSRVDNDDDLVAAIDEAFEYDDKILIEEEVSNPIDMAVAVTGNYFDPDKIQVSKPMLSVNLGGSAACEIKLSATVVKKVSELSKRVFMAFEARGTAQIDFVYNLATKEVFITEIDTIAHNLSLPIWEQGGVSKGEVLRELVRLADQNLEYRLGMGNF